VIASSISTADSIAKLAAAKGAIANRSFYRGRYRSEIALINTARGFMFQRAIDDLKLNIVRYFCPFAPRCSGFTISSSGLSVGVVSITSTGQRW